MKKETYEKIISYFDHSKTGGLILEGISKLLPLAVALVYAALGALLVIFKSPYVVRFIAVPAAVFIFVTIFRYIVNRPRPYTKLGFKPLLRYKEDKGKSFPSRHTASAVIIGFACFYVYPVFGIIVLFAAILVGISRVLTGMHYWSDVIAGALISAAAAYLGFIVW